MLFIFLKFSLYFFNLVFPKFMPIFLLWFYFYHNWFPFPDLYFTLLFIIKLSQNILYFIFITLILLHFYFKHFLVFFPPLVSLSPKSFCHHFYIFLNFNFFSQVIYWILHFYILFICHYCWFLSLYSFFNFTCKMIFLFFILMFFVAQRCG